jgi:hypothetical protein
VGSGAHTHLLHPEEKKIICESGKNAGKMNEDGTDNRGQKPQKLYKSDASFVTCYRCQKLATMNMEAGRPPWKGPNK